MTRQVDEPLSQGANVEQDNSSEESTRPLQNESASAKPRNIPAEIRQTTADIARLNSGDVRPLIERIKGIFYDPDATDGQRYVNIVNLYRLGNEVLNQAGDTKYSKEHVSILFGDDEFLKDVVRFEYSYPNKNEVHLGFFKAFFGADLDEIAANLEAAGTDPKNKVGFLQQRMLKAEIERAEREAQRAAEQKALKAQQLAEQEALVAQAKAEQEWQRILTEEGPKEAAHRADLEWKIGALNERKLAMVSAEKGSREYKKLEKEVEFLEAEITKLTTYLYVIEAERQIAKGEEAQALRSEISALRQSQIFAQQQTMQHLQEQKESSQRGKFGNLLMQQGFEMMRGSAPKARINCTDHYFGTDCTVR